MPGVDPVRQFFDDIGDGEWDRFDKDARSRVALEVHRRFLRRHIPEGSDVLEIGAGPGRFTIELAEMGCRVVVSDISPVQLQANARRVAEAGLEGAVVDRRLLDVRDLTPLPEAGFDAVVAYGGPLSYAFEDAEPSLAGMLRVVRPGGRVVASVMSLIGTLRMFVRLIPAYADNGRLDELKAVMATGDTGWTREATPAGCSAGARSRRWPDGCRAPSSGRQRRTSSRPPITMSSLTSRGSRPCGSSCSTGRRSTAPSRAQWTAPHICSSP